MRSTIEKFGSAVYSPVIFGAFAGMVYGIATVMLMIFTEGAIASVFAVIQAGSWTFFQIMPIVFAIAIPIGMIEKNKGDVALIAIMTYATMILMLVAWMGVEGIDLSSLDNVGMGFTVLFGKKVYDLSILGSIISAVTVILVYNKFYDKDIPEVVRIFSGKVLVYIVAFIVLIPLTFIISLIWPIVQSGILSMQEMIISTEAFGVFVYTFLERILIPTGLHHLVYQPFLVGPAVVNEGLVAYWTAHMAEFAQSTESLGVLYPEGGFQLTGLPKIFAPIGISLAFYKTSRPENKRKVMGILIPTALTAVLFGITEPFEFAFLFVAPLLFTVHALFSALLAVIVYIFGATGFTGGLVMTLAMNWLPMSANHMPEILTQIGVGLVFIPIYYFTFSFLIKKFDFKTMGREDESDDELIEGELDLKSDLISLGNEEQLSELLAGVGGKENIVSITNCATRLRVKINDIDSVKNNAYFKKLGYHGVVKSKNNIQIIVGAGVAKHRAQFEEYVEAQ